MGTVSPLPRTAWLVDISHPSCTRAGQQNPPALMAQAGTQGQWRTLINQLQINPVHVALMNNGQVLIVAGSGNVATETNFQAAVWDPASETFQTQPLAWDMFCNGMVVLARRAGVHQRRQPAVRPVLRRAAERGVRPGDRRVHGRAEHGARALVSHRHHARRRQRDDFFGIERNRRHEHRRGNLHGRFGVEPGVSRGLDAAALPAHAPEHGWSRLLCRLDAKLPVLQSVHENVVGASWRRPTTPAREPMARPSCSP